ncbi:hypothetical protein [Vibrio sagamiensis]|uniref:Lipoprotein n=1 Tax=Vibrio sagamiensis NBRC 104589 TaxID=1219064 RepID=A0A511QHD5_9VIBR|nr:hypothetical protein [Vibrio sagamiensis]PNQ53740.1 hypothetical protein C1141_19625 [Vibrio agarivorans]GEM76681.1 hypothetical protein VSA01S_27930 [Vibrio sagamiensis NBRC 104589]
MSRRKKLLILFIMGLQGGCSSTALDVQLIPGKTDCMVLQSEPTVTYLLPQDYDIDKIKFSNFNKQSGEHTFETLEWSYDSDILRVERRTHNGITGSGVIYEVHRIVSPDKMSVTFEPKKVSKYQDGVAFPYPVPRFNINTFLSHSFYTHHFSVDSKYGPDTVKSNFKRLLTSIDRDEYAFELPGFRVISTIEVLPYRNGSKADVKVNIMTFSSIDNTVDLQEIYRNIENKITAVVRG